MNTYIATVIKTGNSTALRVPKQYATEAQLMPGEKVYLRLPTKQKTQNRAKVIQLFEKLQKLHAFASIADPMSWQREIRKERALPTRRTI